jgi:hypothetical protein
MRTKLIIRLSLAFLVYNVLAVRHADAAAGEAFTSSSAKCPSQSKVWREAELVEIAIRELERRGDTVDRTSVEFKIGQEGCKLVVGGSDVPPRPGGHFAVIVSAETGKVIDFLPGL